jgi:ABC-type nitrate/sulfonate/bicarbonate transport system substrate-binding protein
MRMLLSILLFVITLAQPSVADDQPIVKVGYAKCAHCMPLALLPDYAEGVKIDAIGFATASDALTALVSKSIDVAQITYPAIATALDRGFDVVAISGHVNGGSQMLISNSIDLKPDDWPGLLKLIAADKAQGKPLRVAASRGSAQDLHLRGALTKHGVNVNKDVEFVNIPNPGDHLQAMRRGEADLICTVEPFATDIRPNFRTALQNITVEQGSRGLVPI